MILSRRMFIVITATLLATPAFAEEGVTFRHKMSPADRHIYQTQTEITQTQNVNGQEFDTKIRATEVSLRTLEKLDDKGNFQVKSENKFLKFYVNIGPLGEYEFDSRSDERDTGSVLGGALTPIHETQNGSFFTFVQSPRGEILKVNGLTDLMAGVVKDNPLGRQFASELSDEGMKANLIGFYIPFPEKALKPGESWEVPHDMKLPGVGRLIGTTTYTYVGREEVDGRKLARFTESSEASIEIELEADGAEFTGSLDASESTATMLFDPEKGRLVSKSGRMELAGELSADIGGQTITIEQSQSHKGSIKLLDKLPDE